MQKAEDIVDPDSSIQLYKDIIATSIKTGRQDSVFAVFVRLSERYSQKCEYANSINCMKQSEHYCRNPLDTIVFFSRMGSGYLFMGNYVLASQYYYKALDHIGDSSDFLPRRASIFVSLGLLKIHMHENEKALDYYRKAEFIARQERLRHTLATALIDKCELFADMRELDSINNCFKEIIQLGKELKRPDYLAYAHEDMGIAFNGLGRYAEAAEYLQKAITIADRNRNINIIIDASYHLGDALYHLKKFKQAETTLLSALSHSGKEGMKEKTTNGYATLIAIYKATNRYKEALSYTDSLSNLTNLLINAEKTKVVDELDAKYNIAEKDRLLARSRLQIAEQNSKIAHKNLWILGIGAAILILAIIAAAFYRNSIHKIKVLEQESKIGTLKAAVEGQDNERARIARELHDGIGGMLGAATMRFSTMKPHTTDNELISGYRQAMTLLDEIASEIRQAAHNLMPDQLLKQSLQDAVQAYCGNLKGSAAADITFQSYGDFTRIPERLKLNIYRIIQELLKNVIRHAKANNAFVQLLSDNNTIAITVEDDGVGFDISKTYEGIGLQNINARVKIFDGRLTIDSRPGRGTSVLIEFSI